MTGGSLLPSTRLAIQVAAAGVLSALFVDVVGVERPYWVMMTAVLVMVGSVGETLAKALDRTVGTLLGLVAGLLLHAAAGAVGIPDPVLLLGSVAGMVFFQFVSYRLMVVMLTVMLVVLFRMGGADDGVLLARLYDTALGAAIAGLVSLVVLPIPTQRPVKAAIEAYLAVLATVTDRALAGIIAGRWEESAEGRAEDLRTSEATFETMGSALRLQSALIGGRGRRARLAEAVLPSLRGHVEALVEAARPAAQGGLGREVAGDLEAVRTLIASNLDSVRAALVDGRPATVEPLTKLYGRIEGRLAPRLVQDPAGRHEVIVLLNALLALRRLNRALHHVATELR